MSTENKNLLNTFYSCFQNRDFLGMSRCYHSEIEFSDPVFGKLRGKQVSAMWHMLVSGGKETKISFSNLTADAIHGSAHWEAFYPYGPKRRLVRNVVSSSFEFRDGKIVKQRDEFNLVAWLRMALGPIGMIFGRTTFLQNKVRALANQNLQKFIEKYSEYLT
jgi:limonene-1,2-epoxide hydrolase